MADHRTCKGNRQASDPGEGVPVAVRGSVVAAGRSVELPGVVRGDGTVGSAPADGERAGILCREKGRRLGERSMWRAGSAPGQMTLGGARIGVRRLRVRGPEGEVQLEPFEWAASRDAMDEHTMEAIVSRFRCANHVRTLDTAAPGARQSTTFDNRRDIPSPPIERSDHA